MNDLLYWMTHLRGGTWDSFSDVIRSLNEANFKSLNPRRVSLRMAEHNHIDLDFAQRRWSIRPPELVCVAGSRTSAFIRGARTPKFLRQLEDTVNQLDGSCHSETIDCLPDIIRVRGENLSRVAERLGIFWLVDPTLYMHTDALPFLAAVLVQPVTSPPPSTWRRRAFSNSTLTWSDLLPDQVYAAICCETPWGQHKYYFKSHHAYYPMDRAKAIYLYAHYMNLRLVSYNYDERVLRVVARAPLPLEHSRMLVSCSGASPQLISGEFVYRQIPYSMALALTTVLGQDLPSLPSKETQ